MPSTYAQFKRRWERFRAKGLCGYCGKKPWKKGSSYCSHHLALNRAAVANRREKKHKKVRDAGGVPCHGCSNPLDEFSLQAGFTRCIRCLDRDNKRQQVKRLTER